MGQQVQRINPRTGQLVWVDSADTATMGATQAPADSRNQIGPVLPATTPASQPGVDDRATMWGAHTPDGTFDPGMLRQHNANVLAGFGSMLMHPRGHPAPAPVAPAATPPPPTPPSPPITFGTPQIDPQTQDALTQMQALVGGDYGGHVTAPTLPQAVQYTADPGAAALDERATKRDAILQQLINQREGDVKANDPTQHGWMGRLGEWLSAWAASGDWGAGGQLMSDLRRRDLAQQNANADQLLRLQIAGLDSGDQAAQAHAGSLSATHGAQEHTLESQYGRDTSQAGLDFQASTTNAQLGAETARARAEMALRYLEALTSAQTTARQDWRTAVGMAGNAPQNAGPAAAALSQDISRGNPQMAQPLYQSMMLRQYYTGLVNLVHGLAGQDKGSPQAQELKNLLGIHTDAQWNAMVANPDAFAGNYLSSPEGQRQIHNPAFQHRLLVSAGAASIMAPAQ